MSVQDIFYLLGSIYLALGILLMVVIIATLIYFIKKMQNIERNVRNRVDEEIREIKEKPRHLANYLGHVVAKGIKNLMKNRDPNEHTG
jgi:F0F1-type ATP synthase membrane subunit b/b'